MQTLGDTDKTAGIDVESAKDSLKYNPNKDEKKQERVTETMGYGERK